MAMIKCPECGKEISDKAKVCINCGVPLADVNPAGTVTVAINGTGFVKMYLFDMDTGAELWCGRNGEVARFNVTKETKISVIGSLEKRHPERGAQAVVRGGRKYEYKAAPGAMGLTNWVIREVDVIDSGR